MGQAFQLISGPAIQQLLTATDNRIAQLLKAGTANREMVAELYWSALSRAPTELEDTAALTYLEEAKELRPALEDLTWSLLNAKEFVLRY